MTVWLLDELTRNELVAARRLPVSPAALAEFEAASSLSPSAEASRIRSRSGSTAELEISGVLSERPSLLALLLGAGGTTYRSIRAALGDLDSDDSVADLVIRMSSPGGTVDGLFETIDAIKAFSKPITVRASMACSAAYALAAAAGPITGTTVASSFGSVGVAASFFVDDSQIDIASTEAPNKRPDLRTDAGRSVVREHLDALHAELVSAIASGRQTSPARINAEFGRGATLLAGEAQRRGMIDGIAASAARKDRSSMATTTTSFRDLRVPAPASSASDDGWAVVAAVYRQAGKVPSAEVQEQINRHAPSAARASHGYADPAPASSDADPAAWAVVAAIYRQSGKAPSAEVAAQIERYAPLANQFPPTPPRAAPRAASEAEGLEVVAKLYQLERRPLPADLAAKLAQARAAR